MHYNDPAAVVRDIRSIVANNRENSKLISRVYIAILTINQVI